MSDETIIMSHAKAKDVFKSLLNAIAKERSCEFWERRANVYEIERDNERVGEMDHASYLEKNEGCELEPKCHPTYIHGEVVGFCIIYLYLIYAIFYILVLNLNKWWRTL